ncbi:MAG: pseudouridine synthase, partial [Bacteroidales bacterium]|nr:pseudouridine synthase [Bacteroidales bacterium]
MDFENEKNYEEKPEKEQNAGSREGYPQSGNGFQRDYRGRSPRPRIPSSQRPAYNSGGERQSYNRQSADEGGFRPEGFGSGLQSSQPRQGGYRPRSNYGSQGGYQSRQGQGDYGQSQGQYGQSRGGYGYNSRQGQGGYQPRQGGYRPRYNQDGDEGGYQPRQQQGYRPYGNNGGYRSQGHPGA